MSTTIGELNYIVPTHERPRSFAYIPTDGSPRTTVVSEPHRLPIHDLRQEDTGFTLDGEGFALVEQQSTVADFSDEAQIRQVYYPEAVQLLKDITGADRVFIFDHMLRRRIPGPPGRRFACSRRNRWCSSRTSNCGRGDRSAWRWP